MNCFRPGPVQAQSQYRLFSEAYGNYYNAIQTTSAVFGLDVGGHPNTALVFSGAAAADYGISFAGNGSGTICQDLACATGGGGGGGGGLPIPEPETYALLLSGLGVVAWVARRRRGAVVPGYVSESAAPPGTSQRGVAATWGHP